MQTQQRFLKAHPCPICGGWDDQTRGKGERCWGFVSGDGKYAHCMRPEYAGTLPINLKSQGYPHRLTGDCGCGVRHDPEPARLRGRPRKEEVATVAKIVALYDYTDPDGTLLYQAVRYEPKDFKQRRPNGNGGWLWNLQGVWKVPYHVPALVASPEGGTVYVVEGEKDVHALEALGLVATCNAMGAEKWLPEYSAWLVNRHIVILPDNDAAGERHAMQVARSLTNVASVKVVTLPDLPDKGDVSDWIAAGGTGDKLAALVAATPVWRDPDLPPELAPRTLAQVHEVFQRWLYMPDTGALDVAIATYLANQGEGNPVWLLVVGSPGFGKTEQITPIGALSHAHMISTLTPASLLSGTARKDRTAEAKGGILRQIGDFGILVMKDFTSILSMHGDARVEVLGALREIYDGRWTRSVGTDGGQVLDWSGKVGVIGGCTPAIDEHHAVMSQLGERFVFYRMPDFDKTKQLEMASKAFELPGNESEMRREMTQVVQGLFAGRRPPEEQRYSSAEKAYILRLAQFAVIGRAPIIRENTPSRDIVLVPGHEAPTRFTIILRKLFEGLIDLGLKRSVAWDRIRKVALDSMPQLRLEAIRFLGDGATKTTSEIALKLSYPTKTVHRTLDELQAYQLLARNIQGQGLADLWQLSDWAFRTWQEIETLPSTETGISAEDMDATPTDGGETGISADVYQGINGRGRTDRGNKERDVFSTYKKKSLSHPSLAYPLTTSGERDTETPLRVRGTFTGEDGKPWLDFPDVPGGWPLDRCEVVEGEESA